MDVEIKRKRFPTWWLIPPAVIFCLLLLAFVRGSGDQSIAVSELRIEAVQEGPLVQRIRSVGELEAVVQRRISARTSGEVAELFVEPSDVVNEHDQMLRLLNEELEGELDSARTSLAVAEAELAATRLRMSNQALDIESTIVDKKARLSVAEAELEAAEVLRNKGVVSGIQLMTARAEKERLEQGVEFEKQRLSSFRQMVASSIEAEEAKVRETRRKKEVRKTQVESLAVAAGIAGIVQSLAVSAGETVAQGSEFAVVSQQRPLRVRLQVPQGQAQMITVGDSALVDIRGRVIEGWVDSVAPIVEDGTVDVIVSIDDELPAAARIALSVEADIIVEMRNRTLWAPRPNYISSREAETEILVLSSSGFHAEPVLVELGLITPDAIEILNGLQPGDRIIVNGPDGLQYSERIKVSQ